MHMVNSPKQRAILTSKNQMDLKIFKNLYKTRVVRAGEI